MAACLAPCPTASRSPSRGPCPAARSRGLGERPFGLYVHVPFCTTRCGYCDFNTYTAAELGAGTAAVSPGSYPDLAIAEIRFARNVLAGDSTVRTSRSARCSSAAGRPTLLPPSALGAVLRAIDAEFGLAPGAEVTTEANPESVDEASLSELRAQGVTRVSFGMQSAVPLGPRRPGPGAPARSPGTVRRVGRQAGFEHVSLDLDPGRRASRARTGGAPLDAAVAAGPDHVSAYALTPWRPVRRLAARVRPRRARPPDDDVLADRYLAADEILPRHGRLLVRDLQLGGFRPVEVRAQHALLDRRRLVGDRPGAHSHVGGTRWWNVRHPAAYGARIAAGPSRPGQGGPDRSREAARSASCCSPASRTAARPRSSPRRPGERRRRWSPTAWPNAGRLAEGRIVLTRHGRLLADAVTQKLTEP